MREGDDAWIWLSEEEKVLRIVCDLAGVDYGSPSTTEVRLLHWAWDITHAAGNPGRLWTDLSAIPYRLRELEITCELARQATPEYKQAAERGDRDAAKKIEPPHRAALAVLELIAATVKAQIERTAEMAAASTGRNATANEVALTAWRCFESVTGKEPKPGGGEPTTKYRQFLKRIFAALSIPADTRRPAKWAAEMSRGHDAAHRG